MELETMLRAIEAGEMEDSKWFEVWSTNKCNCTQIRMVSTREEANEYAERVKAWGHTRIRISEDSQSECLRAILKGN